MEQPSDKAVIKYIIASPHKRYEHNLLNFPYHSKISVNLFSKNLKIIQRNLTVRV